jgi:hypothetical protein
MIHFMKAMYMLKEQYEKEIMNKIVMSLFLYFKNEETFHFVRCVVKYHWDYIHKKKLLH